jgi:hypothetical protein
MRNNKDSSTSNLIMTMILAGATGLTAAILVAGTIFTVAPREAAANPAMAQKTGQPCGKCHTAKPPELNAYGKGFKARGNK